VNLARGNYDEVGLGRSFREVLTRIRSTFLALLTFRLLASFAAPALMTQTGTAKPTQNPVLKAGEITPTLFPDKVFFRGKRAAAQLRNAGGVHFIDGMFFLAALVDNSGYSSERGPRPRWRVHDVFRPCQLLQGDAASRRGWF
jgi:hypothetical protein